MFLNITFHQWEGYIKLVFTLVFFNLLAMHVFCIDGNVRMLKYIYFYG